jgi:hypothetical protein
VQGSRIDAEVVGRVGDRGVDGRTDVIRLVGDPPHGCDQHDGHQDEQSEDDHTCGQGRLEPMTLESSDDRLEDDGEHGREEQGKKDLAYRRQSGDHDDRRNHDPDEAPRQDPDLGCGGQRHPFIHQTGSISLGRHDLSKKAASGL